MEARRGRKKLTGKHVPQERLWARARDWEVEHRIGTDALFMVLRQLFFRMPLFPPSWPLSQLPVTSGLSLTMSTYSGNLIALLYSWVPCSFLHSLSKALASVTVVT